MGCFFYMPKTAKLDWEEHPFDGAPDFYSHFQTLICIAINQPLVAMIVWCCLSAGRWTFWLGLKSFAIINSFFFVFIFIPLLTKEPFKYNWTSKLLNCNSRKSHLTRAVSYTHVVRNDFKDLLIFYKGQIFMILLTESPPFVLSYESLLLVTFWWTVPWFDQISSSSDNGQNWWDFQHLALFNQTLLWTSP